MITLLLYVLGIVGVAVVLFVLAALAFGRGEDVPPVAPGTTPTWLPRDEVTGADVQAVRFQQVLRGYKAAEVDWVLDRLAREIDELREQVRDLERTTGRG
ncbi:DivIVA domain-containing protein [Lolliginicoccus suaedae]|uniref:DivIVA domain-containing protein n=1 Tax=Lolliginicoccus suaedae TaxID=2605429 RepID=UPI0011ED176A|nr:DivIVA domain-containing protein [Lolliginicoccus suaedae]